MKISELEEKVKMLNDEKIDIINSIQSNTSAIKKFEAFKTLNDRVGHLEEQIDDENAYSRRESLIFSGPAVISEILDNENCTPAVVKLLKSNLNIQINPNDISVSHRLGTKSNQQGPDKRSIIAKFCRRDLKRDILAAARRVKPSNFFVNESLTNVRQKINKALRAAKSKHPNVISGITTIEGRVCVEKIYRRKTRCSTLHQHVCQTGGFLHAEHG